MRVVPSKFLCLCYQAFATDDGSFDQYLKTCDKHGQPTRRLDGLYINEPTEMAITPRMSEWPQTSTDCHPLALMVLFFGGLDAQTLIHRLKRSKAILWIGMGWIWISVGNL